MGFGFLLAGVIFLFDPFINIFDILPDVIGYALMAYGLSRLSDLELKAAEAKRRIMSALFVAAGRIGVIALSFVMEFDATLVLVFAFSLATLEIFFVIPAFNMLFEALPYSCMRFSEKTINDKAENLQKVTPVFIVVRAICAVVPQLTVLTNEYGYVGEETGLEGSGVIAVALMAICAIVSLVFGILWLSMALPYFKSLRDNRELNEYFLERYSAEVETDEVLHIRRSIKRFTALVFASIFFFICIPIDEFYITPDFFVPALLLLAFYFAKKYTADYKKTVGLCAVASVVTLAAYCLLFRYASVMGYIYFPYKAEGFWGFFAPYAVFSVASHVLMLFVYKRAFKALGTIVESCMGLRDTKDARRREADDYRKKELCAKVKGLSAAVYALVLVSGVMMLASPWFALSWAVRLAAAVIAAVWAYNIKSDIYDEAEKIL